MGDGSGVELLDTVSHQLSFDVRRLVGVAVELRLACLKYVYVGCFYYRGWQCVPVWNSSWEEKLLIHLSICTYNALL